MILSFTPSYSVFHFSRLLFPKVPESRLPSRRVNCNSKTGTPRSGGVPCSAISHCIFNMYAYVVGQLLHDYTIGRQNCALKSLCSLARFCILV